jgi:hypothetical protein
MPEYPNLRLVTQSLRIDQLSHVSLLALIVRRPIGGQYALSLLTASRASEHLPLVIEVLEIVVGFGSFGQRRELPAVRARGRLFLARTFRWWWAIVHKRTPLHGPLTLQSQSLRGARLKAELGNVQMKGADRLA